MPKIHDAIIAGITKELGATWYKLWHKLYDGSDWYRLNWLQDDEGNRPTEKIAITDGKIWIGNNDNKAIYTSIDLSDPNLIEILRTKLPCPTHTTSSPQESPKNSVSN
jgi:hypothetical protein